MNWKRVICWLRGHKFRIQGNTLAEVVTATTRTCKRCGLTEPYEVGQLIPDSLWELLTPLPKPLSGMFPPPEKEES